MVILRSAFAGVLSLTPNPPHFRDLGVNNTIKSKPPYGHSLRYFLGLLGDTCGMDNKRRRRRKREREREKKKEKKREEDDRSRQDFVDTMLMDVCYS